MPIETTCEFIDGTYSSVSEHECGTGGPDEAYFCHWHLTLRNGGFDWLYSDVEEAGSFACSDGQLEALFFAGDWKTAGRRLKPEFIEWFGVEYQRYDLY